MTLLRNASIRVRHLRDDRKDIDMMLRFVVSRLEADRYISEVKTLGVEELARASTAVAISSQIHRLSRKATEIVCLM